MTIQIAKKTLATIRDNMRRVLNNEYLSDKSQANLPTNVIKKREYPYNTNDYSLIASNNDSVANAKVEQMILDVQTHRRH